MCAPLLAAPQRNQGAEPLITQPEPTPDQHSDINGKQCRRKQWATDAHLGGNGATEISRQENRAENRCRRKHIDDGTEKLDDAEADGDTQGIAQTGKCVDDRLNPQQMPDRVEEHEEDRQRTEYASGPKPGCRLHDVPSFVYFLV